MIGRAMSIGIAKPMPDESVATAVLMPDDRAGGVHERATGVAGVDRRVGLEQVREAAAVVDGDGPAPAGQDAARHRERVRAEGRPDRHDQLADLEPVGGADRRDGQAGRVHLDDGEVGEGVDAVDAALELAAVARARPSRGRRSRPATTWRLVRIQPFAS